MGRKGLLVAADHDAFAQDNQLRIDFGDGPHPKMHLGPLHCQIGELLQTC